MGNYNPVKVKDPSEQLDFGIDWATLLGVSETISTSTWTVPAGITKMTDPPASISGSITGVWLDGGTAGETYTVVNTIVTSAGRRHERSLYIQVKNR